jgi:hypothetical protein
MEQSPSFLRSQPVFAASEENPLIFMETESSLPYSQVRTTCPCPEPTTSSPHNPLQHSHYNVGYFNFRTMHY